MDVEAEYREHAPRLLAYLRARLPAAAAEDVHHDAWLKALTHARGLRGDDLRRWLFRVAQNRLKDLAAKASTRRERGGVEVDPPAPDAGPDTTDRDELVARLQRCVDGLPDAYREVVRAKLGGKTPDEIAAKLGIPRGTVDTRFHKAKDRLRTCTERGNHDVDRDDPA